MNRSPLEDPCDRQESCAIAKEGVPRVEEQEAEASAWNSECEMVVQIQVVVGSTSGSTSTMDSGPYSCSGAAFSFSPSRYEDLSHCAVSHSLLA